MLDPADGATVATPTNGVPWDLTTLDAEPLRAAMTELRRFVDQLRVAEVDVPVCWYVHGWVRERLVILLHWQRADYRASAAEAGRWWQEGLVPLTREWEALLVHGSRHPDPEELSARLLPIPSFDDAVEQMVRDRRDEVSCA